MVYDIDVSTGFSLHGRVAHPVPFGFYGSGAAVLCSNWWTHASSPVKRSAFVEGTVFSLGESLLKVSPIDNLSQELGRFTVGQLPCSEYQGADACSEDIACQSLDGIAYESGESAFVGCATRRVVGTSLVCNEAVTCAAELASKVCATLSSDCVPDGWVKLADGACTAELCGG